jgi:hypothetical protein
MLRQVESCSLVSEEGAESAHLLKRLEVLEAPLFPQVPGCGLCSGAVCGGHAAGWPRTLMHSMGAHRVDLASHLPFLTHPLSTRPAFVSGTMPITADALFRDVCSRLPAAAALREDWIGLQAFLIAKADFMTLAATATPHEFRFGDQECLQRKLGSGCGLLSSPCTYAWRLRWTRWELWLGPLPPEPPADQDSWKCCALT